MDPKSQAKSKRSHSLHGKNVHPSPSSTPHKKKSSPAAADKPPKTRSPALPSNWDRYDDEKANDLGAEVATASFSSSAAVAAKKLDGEVVPKSKGADFAWLIEQARSKPADHPEADQSSSDDISINFMQGASSLLSVRGKGLLSWSANDNFVVDDEPVSSFEVPCLNLDLNALAEQLSKLKMSQRLFIDADLLPEELDSIEAERCKVPEQSRKPRTPIGHQVFDAPTSPRLVDSEKIEYGQSENRSHTNISGVVLPEVEVENAGAAKSSTLAPVTDFTEHWEALDDANIREAQESISQVKLHNNQEPKWSKTESFKATAAEAELDMLLDSFDGSHCSSSASLIGDNSIAKTTDFSSSNLLVPPSMKQGQTSLRHVAKIHLDDALDDLLAESSLSMQGPHNDGAASSVILPQSSLRPKSVDDFDSWLDSL